MLGLHHHDRYPGLLAGAAFAFSLILIPPASGALDCEPALVSISPLSDQLRTLSLDDASTLASVPIVLAGQVVSGGTGLAVNPVTGELWAILKIGGPFRELVTVDPWTGIATSVGTADLTGLAGIAFDGSGTLYGVTGDGGSPPETLFVLSTVDASSTFLLTLGAGEDGETIGYNPDDGLLYHASGIEGDCAGKSPAQSTGVCFESIAPVGLAISEVDISGTDLTTDEARALVYWESEQAFIWGHGPCIDRLFTVTLAGAVVNLGLLDHPLHGLAMVRELDPALFLDPAGLAWCPTGGATGYDIVRGDLVVLISSGGNFTAATEECLIDDDGSPGFPYTLDPDPGEGFWFLARTVSAAGNRTYDTTGAGQTGVRDAEIAAGPDCP